MKHDRRLEAAVVLTVLVLGLAGGPALVAQDPLAAGNIAGRMEIPGAEGLEAIVVERDIPPGAESGFHVMETGAEIVYILEGSAVLEVKGMPPLTVEAGQTFTTVAGEVHNVKNASDESPVRALAFYVAQTGTTLDALSVAAE